MSAQTIFGRYGGFATIRKVVSEFYDRVLDADGLSHHFERIDMKRLLDHQARFMAFVMGGPASYTDEHLRRVHARLGITTEEFRELIDLLDETLEDFEFAREDREHVVGELRRREGVIVNG